MVERGWEMENFDAVGGDTAKCGADTPVRVKASILRTATSKYLFRVSRVGEFSLAEALPKYESGSRKIESQ
jgi:hypothetical protein